MSPFFLFESPWLLCAITVHALCVLALLNTVNFSTIVDHDNQITVVLLYYNIIINIVIILLIAQICIEMNDNSKVLLLGAIMLTANPHLQCDTPNLMLAKVTH